MPPPARCSSLSARGRSLRRPLRRGLRLALAVLAAGSAVSGGALAVTARAAIAPAASAAPPVAAAEEDVLRISVATMEPASLSQRDTFRVTGTVFNAGSSAVSQLQVALAVDWKSLTRDEVAAWSAGSGTDSRSTLWERVSLRQPLPAGASTAFTVVADAAALQLGSSAISFGPRGVSLTAQGVDGSGARRSGSVHSFVVWNPTAEYAATRLSLAAPITAPGPLDDPSRPNRSLLAAWRPSGQLDTLLTAAADTAFGWVVDPAVLDAAQVAAGGWTAAGTPSRTPSPGTGGATPASAGPSVSGTPGSTPSGTTGGTHDAQAWLGRLTALRGARDVLRLPYGDPDLAALAGAEQTLPDGSARQVVTEARTEGRAVTPLASSQEVGWPGAGGADRQALTLAGQAGSRLLLSEPPDGVEAGRLRTGHVQVPTPERALDALVADPALSAALAGTGAADDVLATQRLLAETAAAAAEHPTDPAHLLALAPRDWEPDPARVTRALAVLRSVPWVTLQPLSTLAARPASALPEAAPTPRVGQRPAATGAVGSSSTAALPARHLSRVLDAERQLLGYRSALSRPELLVGRGRRTALALLGLPWRGRGEPELARGRAALEAQLSTLRTGISVNSGGSKNLLGTSGGLPVTVQNRLDQPITVQVALQPHSAKVVAGSARRVLLPAGRSQQVRISIRALANGDVPIEVQLRAPDGSLLGPPSGFELRVHTDWENRALLTVGLILVALLIGGLARGVRRGRRPVVPAESVPDLDDLAQVAGAPGLITRRNRRRAGLDPDTGALPVLPAPPTSGQRSTPPDAGTDPDDRRDDRDDRDGGAPPAAGGAASAPGGGALPAREHPGGTTLTLARDPGSTSSPAAPSPAAPGPTDPRHPDDAADTGPNAALDAGPDTDPDAGRSRTASLLSSSALMSAGTLLSRILGMVRVVVLSWAIGQSLSADVFSTANTVPNSVFALIGGGVFNAVLVPQIIRATANPDGGKEYVDRLVTFCLVVLGASTAVVTVAAPWIVPLYARQWTPEQHDLGVAFALWCLPQVFFYGMYTVFGQVLNARGSFGPWAWAPVVNNVVSIAGMGVFIAAYGPAGRHGTPVTWWGADSISLLAGTATLGVTAQALILFPALRRSGYRWRPRWGVRGVGLGTAGRVAGWTFAGALVGQLGWVFVSQAANAGGVLAAEAGGSGGRAVYDNAFLLFMLPHSLVAVSIVTAVFNRVSDSARRGDHDQVRADISLTVRLTAVATVLATAAFVVLGRDLAYGIFLGRTPRAVTDMDAYVAAAMALGLVPFSAQYLFQRVYYAYQDARTPFRVQVVTVAVWACGALACVALLPGRWVVIGVGLSMAVSNMIGASITVVLLRRRFGSLDGRRVLDTHARLAVAALVAAVLAWPATSWVHLAFGYGYPATLLAVALGGGIMLSAYLALLRLLRVEELSQLLGPLTQRLRGADTPG